MPALNLHAQEPIGVLSKYTHLGYISTLHIYIGQLLQSFSLNSDENFNLHYESYKTYIRALLSVLQEIRDNIGQQDYFTALTKALEPNVPTKNVLLTSYHKKVSLIINAISNAIYPDLDLAQETKRSLEEIMNNINVELEAALTALDNPLPASRPEFSFIQTIVHSIFGSCVGRPVSPENPLSSETPKKNQ